jgi:hypothetical protein
MRSSTNATGRARRLLPLLIAAAAAAAATALLLAGGGSAQGPNAQTIQLVERPVQFTEVPNPPKGTTQGDEAVLRGQLKDAAGQAVGTDYSVCVAVKGGNHPVGQCTNSYFLQDGRITAVGGVNLDQRKQLLPVVGGSGAYEGAKGTVLTELGRKKTVLTFELKP